MSFIGGQGQQVLTAYGWKYWEQLGNFANLMIPSLRSKKLIRKSCNIIEEKYKGNVYTHDIKDFKYAVTEDHIIPCYNSKGTNIINRGSKERRKVKQNTIISGSSFSLYNFESFETNPLYILVGFMFAHGRKKAKRSSKVYIQLTNERRVEYLHRLLNQLNISSTTSKDKKGYVTFSMEDPFKNWILADDRKSIDRYSDFPPFITGYFERLNSRNIINIAIGLMNSDGPHEQVGQSYKFSSTTELYADIIDFGYNLLNFDSYHAKPKTYKIEYPYYGRPIRPRYPVGISMYNQPTIELYCHSNNEERIRVHRKTTVYNATSPTNYLMVRGGENRKSYISCSA